MTSDTEQARYDDTRERMSEAITGNINRMTREQHALLERIKATTDEQQKRKLAMHYAEYAGRIREANRELDELYDGVDHTAVCWPCCGVGIVIGAIAGALLTWLWV